MGRPFTLGWDWQVAGPRTFEVALTLSIAPTREQPDEASVTIAGTFRAGPDPVAVPFSEFVQFNAPAILLPFVREAVVALTRRGPHGSFLLMPLNVQAIMAGTNPTETTGAKFLRANPEAAQAFGLA